MLVDFFGNDSNRTFKPVRMDNKSSTIFLGNTICVEFDDSCSCFLMPVGCAQSGEGSTFWFSRLFRILNNAERGDFVKSIQFINFVFILLVHFRR